MSETPQKPKPEPTPAEATAPAPLTTPPAERLDPTRYGDWELNGKCVDF